ncbi:MAG: hypothetical protein SGPRY_000877 [Prymnesium sp.]
MSGREAAVSAGLLAAAAVLVARARVRAARERRRASPYVPRPLHYWDYPSFPLVASPLAPEAEFASALAQIREERTQQMLVVANGDDTTAVAACALMLEPKFLRGGSWVAHLASILPPMQPTIPDMARAYRTLLREALERARSAGCYKAIFDSSTPAESELMLEMGFVLSQLAMQRDLRPASARGPAAELPASPALPKLDGGQLRDMQLRSLVSSDSAAYIQLLKQLSVAIPMEAKAFDAHLQEARRSRVHRITVVEDVGCFSISVQRRPFHACGLVGHLEDVVIDSSRRGIGLGRAMVTASIFLAEQLGCCQLLLNCKQENAAFYEKCGFTQASEGGFSIYFDEVGHT